MEKERVYISGAISGLPIEDYTKQFEEAEKDIAMWGLEAINPVRVCGTLPKDTTWQEYMDVCMCLLKMCHKVYMLEGWEQSHGATIELRYAQRAGYDVIVKNGEVKDGYHQLQYNNRKAD